MGVRPPPSPSIREPCKTKSSCMKASARTPPSPLQEQDALRKLRDCAGLGLVAVGCAHGEEAKAHKRITFWLGCIHGLEHAKRNN